MLKHIVHSSCNRNCSYCITSEVTALPVFDSARIEQVYRELYMAGHHNITITGGEPLLYRNINEILKIADSIFDKVFLITQHKSVLDLDLSSVFAVTYSVHDVNEPLLKVKSDKPFYASYVDLNFEQSEIQRAAAAGFSGVTICEELRGGARFNEDYYEECRILATSLGITLRVHDNTCLHDVVMLPDLSTYSDFLRFV